MAVLEPGAMFGFSALLACGGLSEATVIVRGAAAVLLKLPPPPQAAGKEAASELRDVAEAMARQEAADVAEFLTRERMRLGSGLPNTHFKVRKQFERAFESNSTFQNISSPPSVVPDHPSASEPCASPRLQRAPPPHASRTLARGMAVQPTSALI
jgi:hypothetical protein